MNKYLVLILLFFLYIKGYGQNYIEKYNTTVRKFSIDSLECAIDKINSANILRSDKTNNLIDVDLIYNSRDSIIYEDSIYNIKIIRKKFINNEHIINIQDDQVLEIDSLIKFGTRFSYPEFEISEFEVKYKGIKVEIPKNEWKNFFNPFLGCIKDIDGIYCGTKVFFDINTQRLYIYIEGADGGDFYSVVFIFKNNFYYKKVIYIP